MSDAGISELSADPVAVLAKVEERFRLDLTDEMVSLLSTFTRKTNPVKSSTPLLSGVKLLTWVSRYTFVMAFSKVHRWDGCGQRIFSDVDALAVTTCDAFIQQQISKARIKRFRHTTSMEHVPDECC